MMPHGYTYGGHPVSCAVAMANLDIFEKENLCQYVRDTEGYFLDTLKEKLGHLEIVGNIRGCGFFYGIEMVIIYLFICLIRSFLNIYIN